MKKLYSFDDHPEHKAQLPLVRDRWIANAMSTATMTADDKIECVAAVKRLYAAAKLPPPKRIVFVPSPIMGAFVAGFAAWWWKMHGSKAAATAAATDAATAAATAAAMRWFRAPIGAFVAAANGLFARTASAALQCAARALNMRAGGNQWSAWASYLSFFKDVAKLDLPRYAAYEPWETLALRSGPRYVHPDFCIISDRPELLTVDDQRRPHNDDGPFCRWRDGTALYAVHGVRVPAWIVEFSERITVNAIKAEGDAEVRRVMRERYGEGRYLAETKAVLIDVDHEGSNKGAAPRCLLQDDEGRRFLVGTDGSTSRVYYMEVDAQIETCAAGHESLCGFEESRIRSKS